MSIQLLLSVAVHTADMQCSDYKCKNWCHAIDLGEAQEGYQTSYASWAFLGSSCVFGVCSCLYRHSDFGYVRSLRASQVICITI